MPECLKKNISNLELLLEDEKRNIYPKKYTNLQIKMYTR